MGAAIAMGACEKARATHIIWIAVPSLYELPSTLRYSRTVQLTKSTKRDWLQC